MRTEKWLLARYVRTSGDNKDWAIAVIDGEAYIRHGKEGVAMPRKPLNRRGEDVLAFARRRLREQLDDGYDVVGLCTFGADKKVAGVEPDPRAEIPVHVGDQAGPSRFNADAHFEVQASSWQALYELMSAALGLLSDHFACRWGTKQGVPTALPVVDGWTPAFEDHSGTGAVRHNGSLRRADGVGPLLYVLALRHLASGTGAVKVSVAKADGSDVHPDLRKEESLLASFGSSLELVTSAAENVGLVPKRIRLTEVRSEVENLWF